MERHTLEKLIPTPEQQAAIDTMVDSPTESALCAAQTGTGKTVLATEVARGIGAETVLVVCPLGTRVGWERTFTRQGWGYPVSRIDSTKKGKTAFDSLKSGAPGLYLIGREYMRRLDWKGVTPDLLVVDEVHFIQNRKSKGFQKLKTIKAGYKLGLSGTPFRNKFEGAWSVTRWLFPENVDRSFWRWAVVWTKTEFDPFTYNKKKIVGERNPGEYVAQLPCYTYIESKVAGAVTETRYVELTPKQRKIYDQMQEDMVSWLDENPLVADLPVTQRIRLRQMALGVPEFDEEGQIHFALDCVSPKIKALKEILSDLDTEPVLILTDSQRFARAVTHQLGKYAAEYSGATPHSERERILREFGGEVRYLVASIGAIGEGTDGLQNVCSNMVWLSRSEDGIMNEQAEARLVRMGQTEQVTSFDILATGTYDEGILSKLLTDRLERRRTLDG